MFASLQKNLPSVCSCWPLYLLYYSDCIVEGSHYYWLPRVMSTPCTVCRHVCCSPGEHQEVIMLSTITLVVLCPLLSRYLGDCRYLDILQCTVGVKTWHLYDNQVAVISRLHTIPLCTGHWTFLHNHGDNTKNSAVIRNLKFFRLNKKRYCLNLQNFACKWYQSSKLHERKS